MHILFKRHGKSRLFKKYNSFEDLTQEIKKGHNEKFPGNNQFYLDTDSDEITILNSRLSLLACKEQIEESGIVAVNLV